jgi:serine/threonine-protein kinase
LPSYTGDPEDDLPTRLYSPSAPPPGATTTQPRNDKPRLITQPVFAARVLSQWWPPPKWYLIGGAIGVILASLLLYFTMRSGTLVVTVTGPAGKAIDTLEVIVDGTKRCDTSPCIVSGLSAGAHLVRATAKGYEETADQAVAIESGQHAVQTIALSPTGAGTAIRVSALGSGLKLYVDSQEIGELPQTAKGIEPGEHTLRVAGSDRYEPWEEKISIQEGETKNIGPLRLRVLKGLATFKAGAGADGARVLLDGRLVPELPATIEVPAGKQLALMATKPGYSAYRRTISFNDGVAEKTFEITMAENGDGEGAPEDVGPSRSFALGPSRHVSTHTPAPQAPAEPPVAKGKATLNLNSIPVSNVILNGKPLGPTPKIGVQVPPGPQTVVFVHPDLGRKVMSGTVAAGETKTFMARLR